VIKFIVDAQLPYRLALLLREKGYDTVHTDDLPNKERTTDTEIRTLSKAENRIVITKDNDFFESYIIKKSPAALLLVSTGNIVNKDLFTLFNKYFDLIIKHFETHNFVEITNDEIFAHE
jgi:predicted nuclease of predicted toxin-antitoxin system